MDKPKHSLLTGSFLALQAQFTTQPAEVTESRSSPGRHLMPASYLAPDKDQAISFKAIKACYPLTIKGGLFSLLCYQPEAVPTSLKTLTYLLALIYQYLPLI
jgi:hypothetical protein